MDFQNQFHSFNKILRVAIGKCFLVFALLEVKMYGISFEINLFCGKVIDFLVFEKFKITDGYRNSVGLA